MSGSTSGGIRTLFRLQRTIVVLLFISFVCGMVLGISLVTNTDLGTGILGLLRSERQGPPGHASGRAGSPVSGRIFSKEGLVLRDQRSGHQILRNSSYLKLKTAAANRSKKHYNLESPELEGEIDTGGTLDGEKFPSPNYNVHVFYYPWYGTPKTDGKWLHWNHQYLQHWDKQEASKWPSGRHEPPDDIGSSFYPELGPYSSRDPAVVEAHMKQIRSAGIGVLAVSWYPPNQADHQGQPWDDFLPQLFDIAANYSVKVSFHIEPYKNRSHLTLRKNLQYIVDRYGPHPAMYRHTYHGRNLPLYYIYDSYFTPAHDWAKVLRNDGAMTVRHTPLDGIFIGLVVEDKQKSSLIQAGFDGFYTYFASDGFTYGSSTRNWPLLSSFALTNGALFIPSVGPGYVDRRVRPWNDRNTKDREQGGYYEQSFKAALLTKPSIVTITSFNEWHEGTQIEKAVSKKTAGYHYLDYSPNNPDYYLMLTRKWVHKFKRHRVD